MSGGQDASKGERARLWQRRVLAELVIERLRRLGHGSERVDLLLGRPRLLLLRNELLARLARRAEGLDAALDRSNGAADGVLVLLATCEQGSAGGRR